MNQILREAGTRYTFEEKTGLEQMMIKFEYKYKLNNKDLVFDRTVWCESEIGFYRLLNHWNSVASNGKYWR